jgi:very-short-patch-repair endonuclease
VVELDGGQQQVSIKYDSARTDYLNQHGFSVIRFWNNQVLTEINGVKEAILLSLTIQIEKPDPPQILSLTRKSELF